MAIKKTLEKFIPKFFLSIYHYKLALLSAFCYGFPGRKIKVIGVTGTKGKSTTVILIGKILEEAGYKVAWFTSATIKVNDKEILNPYHMTMPGRFVIQKFLKEAVGQKCDYALLEVTSEGAKQHRHRFINFNTAVFTNLRPEHIEAHGSFENYRYCKGLLFKATKKNHVLNFDDKNFDYFTQFKAERKMGFSVEKQGKDVVFGKNLEESRDGIKFGIDGVSFNLKLLGKFNIYNALAAISTVMLQGVTLEICKKALEKIPTLPGRMEVLLEKPFKVIVDLAHTPDSYEEVFKSAKAMPHKRIIAVFGSAGGGRDKWKRPVLGKVAAQTADIIILCNEDPYDENPEEILKDIQKGIDEANFKEANFYEVLDRRDAIKKALELAEEDDIVLILGKGTEQLMFLPSGKIPWDDRTVVKEEIKRLTSHS